MPDRKGRANAVFTFLRNAGCGDVGRGHGATGEPVRRANRPQAGDGSARRERPVARSRYGEERRRRLARRLYALCAQARRRGGCGRGGGQGRQGPDAARLRICRCRNAPAGRSRNHAFQAGVGVEADHLDRGDAARRAGQDRSRPRHQRLSRFQDSGLRRQAGYDAQPDDAHRGFRRSAARAQQL